MFAPKEQTVKHAGPSEFSKKLYDFFEANLQAAKFHGLYFAVKFFFTGIKVFFAKQNNGSLTLFGQKLAYLDKESIRHALTELFGHNAYYLSCQEKSPVIVDLGANIGDSVTYFKWQYPEARIYSFEPGQKTFNLLKQNITSNGYKNVEIFNFALGGREGTAQLYSDDSNTYLGSTIQQTEKTEIRQNFEPVAVKRLSDQSLISNLSSIDFLKVDIEGSEAAVLEDIQDLLPKVKQIVVEYHLTFEYRNSFDRIVTILNNSGFDVGLTGASSSFEILSRNKVCYILGKRNGK